MAARNHPHSKPDQQGEFDGLCGVYSILNSIKLLYHLSQDDLGALFQSLCESFPDKFPHALWNGFGVPEIRHLLNYSVAYVGENGANGQLFGQVDLFGRFDFKRLQFQTGCRFQGILEAIMKIEGSVGKGRLNEAETRRWFAPLLSTSNISVPDLAKQAGQPSDSAFLDRLADVPVPSDGHGMFETLHGFVDVAAFSVELKRLAAENHGWAGRKFVQRLLRAKKKEVSAVKKFIEERRTRYTRKAKRKIASSTRDLSGNHGGHRFQPCVGNLECPFRHGQDALMARIDHGIRECECRGAPGRGQTFCRQGKAAPPDWHGRA